ncbi:hypothetical protein BCR35DRAFT_315144 [Leucosporidium creatinivorum]|uniref:YMC020W-like alpha/beta hydrolase domain-containing protein n=1 Tax=Leucosporidium creatinivorum TaxID=106004 RepID=A0A1Y2ELH8_9BASI|nr:hypothetical protein BCR35DRAFT_315144 [Leucosporidium creatinivorum]
MPKSSLEPVVDAEVDRDGDTRMSDPSAESSSTPAPAPADPPSTSNALTVPPSSTVAQTQDRARQLALQQASASIVAQSAAGKGWFSILSRSTSTASLPTAAAKAEAKGAAGEGSDATSSGDGSIEQSGSADTGKEVKDGERGGTIKGSTSTADYDDSTLTPRPSRTPVPTVANQRASWWGWGSSAEGAAEAAAETATVRNEQASESTAGRSEEPPIAEDSPSTSSIAAPIAAAAPPPKSWLTTIWGEFPDEASARKKVVEAAARAQAQGSSTKAMVIEGAGSSAAIKDSSDVSSTSASTTHSASDKPSTIAVPPPAAVQALKHQSSWSFFPSRRSSSGTSLLPNGTPPGPNSKLGVASSAASTRSRTSTTTEGGSAPSSPFLAPADAPLKPLTGSIRNSARPAPYEPDPPFENLVLPTFTDTFERPPRSFPLEKSKLTKAVSVVSAYLFHQPPPTSPPLAGAAEKRHMLGPDPAARLPKTLDVVEEPARLNKVKRVVTIGVHGWFPTQKLKVVFGEPTGTSVKFATMMHDAVQSYLESKDISSFNIQAIALEGHGKIEDRVNKLYDQLIGREEWVQALKKADVVFLATHSQGSVASTQLLARMLDQGLIEGAHTHMLAMCAIAQGPFVYLYQSYTLSPYFNYVESEPARELFEFQDPESVPAIKFLESLRIILAAGIKVTVVGSINDQVVPLYSALFSGISHPGILRAVYIDSQAFRTSDFLANLVVFAARLRNAGLQDHDLVYHVSEALAGALTGVGHSKIYEEEEVFNLAVRYAFETTTLAESPTLLDHKAHSPALSMSFNPRDRRNPYLLTWALRGIIEDPQVRELFGKELTALREAFETWKPQTKTLKEVKLKLEGIRMLQRAKDGKL